uniref:TSA: Wollemia nobilis Ref_Wollemi_Transcript_14115_1857 transcribed RNA sequence n=1 Tax=Wollemia nobilis TaxID=56998 RepID=A0A0C9S6Z1_9CONI
MMAIRQKQLETLVPLIERRRTALAEGKADDCRAYVDSLLSVTVDGGRHLTENELVTLCSEFINGGTDTTSTTMQWLMANLVKHPHIQAKLYDEIVVVAGKEKPVEDDDLSRMPYLEAVVKETLRRHPPGMFVLPHAVTEACALGGYVIPAGATVNFCVGEMGNDPRVWENPADFVPERFLGVDVDMTGSKEIKMMPFGAGRRICPGWGLAILHMELIVGRLVQKFKWECKPGETVELDEKQEFTTVMKNPLQAVVKER